MTSCRALVRTMPAVYAVVGPVRSLIEPDDIRFAPEHATLWTISPRGRYAAQVNGSWISRAQWHLPLRAGDIVAFVHVAQGGGDSSPVRFLLQIAVLVAAAYTGGAAAAAYGATAGAFAQAGVALVGSLLVNALAPLPGVPVTAATSPSPTYTIAAQGNQARLGGSIPVGYGTELVYPDFAAQPYIEFDDANEQYFCAVLCRGIGHYEIVQVYIDDTPIENFGGVTVARIGPGQTARGGTFRAAESFDSVTDVADSRIVSSLEIGGQDLSGEYWIGPFTVNAAGTDIDRIYLDLVFPRGLGTAAGDGSVSSRAVTVEAQVREVNDFGLAVGNWTDVGSSEISDATTSVVRRSIAFDAPAAARYQVRIRRTVAKSDNALHLNDLQWFGLRGRLAVTSGIDRTDVTGLAIRMKANEQLSGLAQRRIGLLAKRLVPVYNTSTETWGDPVESRNPAHAFADLLHDSTYGRGLDDSRIDHETLAELAALYEARQDRFDYTFDSRITVDDALRVIARAGRAVPIFRRGAIYSMVRDGQQAGPVAAFMPRNMAQDSFSVSYSLPTEDTPDAVRLTYRSNATWQNEVVIGQVANGVIYAYDEPSPPFGVTDPENVVDVQIAGICGRNHALREAAYIVANAYYRRTTLSWTTEMEGMLPAFGSLVSVAHDVSAWAQSGDVYSYTDTDGAYLLTPADPVTWTAGEQHYVRLIDSDGSVGEAVAVERSTDPDGAIILPAQPTTPIVTDSDSRERTRFLFGALPDVTRYARIVAIVPQDQRTMQITAILEDDRVHEADSTFVPGTEAEQDPVGGGGTIDRPADGSNAVVALSSREWTDYAFNYNTADLYPGITLRFKNDGQLEIQTVNPDWRWFHTTATIPADGIPRFTIDNEWMTPNPVSAAVTGQYEIKFSVVGGDVTEPDSASATLDAWLSLDTTREVFFQSAGPVSPEGNTYSTQLYVYIRRAIDEVELAQALFTLYFVHQQSPGYSDA